MPKFSLPDPNDKVLEEEIKWARKSNRERKRGLTKTRLRMDSVNISCSGTRRAAFTFNESNILWT